MEKKKHSDGPHAERHERAMAAFGARLRLLRKLGGLTQAQLAERAGISLEHVNKLERGVAAPSFTVICALAQALHTEPANLFLYRLEEPLAAGPAPGEPPQPAPGMNWTRYIAHIGFCMHEFDSGALHCSDSFFRMLGYAPGELESDVDVLLERHVAREDMARVQAARASMRAGQSVERLELRFYRKDGNLRVPPWNIGALGLFPGGVAPAAAPKNVRAFRPR